MISMRLMIASDIHGSARYCREMLKAYEQEKPDRLVLLGDILYHGPRNDLPEEYNPKQVIAMLNPLARQILCVRGNCDTEVDQMVLDFSVLSDYALLFDGTHTFYLTHGHLYTPESPIKGCHGVMLGGHTHVPVAVEKPNFVYANPGSVSIPKENSPRSYLLYEQGRLVWKDLAGDPYMEYVL